MKMNSGNKKIGIYPGSFDPITNGHIDIIKRSLDLFDEVIVLVSVNNEKSGKFDFETRKRLINESIKELENEIDISKITVDSYEGLTVEYAKKHNSKFIIRGLRVVSDFEYEWQLYKANEFIDKDIEMIFLMAREDYTFISSSSVLELAKYSQNVDISPLVPKPVLKALEERFNIKK